jgi:hypothetical protein
MAYGLYAAGLAVALKAGFDWDTDTIKVMLVETGYTHDETAADTYDFVADIAANRMTGTTDQTVGTCTATVDSTNNDLEFDGVDVTFSSVQTGSTVIGVAVYKFETVDADSPLIGYLEFVSSVPTNGSDIDVAFNADGLWKIAYTVQT